MSEQQVVAQSQDVGQRLDIFCVAHFPGYSRATIQKGIKSGAITVNGEQVKPKYLVQEGDTVITNLDPVEQVEQIEIEIPSIPTLYEDEDVVVINKPAGVITHPAPGAPNAPSVTAWFTEKYPESKNVGDEGRPGIVHRIDQDTSGVLILTKNAKAFEHLKSQFKKRRVQKEYRAIVFGVPSGDDGRVARPISRSKKNPTRRTAIPKHASKEEALLGKPAITDWRINESFGTKFALIDAHPLTGRTHQIRVHLHHLGHPIAGDHLYVFKRQKPPVGVKRLMLHAYKLKLKLPSDKRKEFEAPIPQDMTDVLEGLRTKYGSEVRQFKKDNA